MHSKKHCLSTTWCIDLRCLLELEALLRNITVVLLWVQSETHRTCSSGFSRKRPQLKSTGRGYSYVTLISNQHELTMFMWVYRCWNRQHTALSDLPRFPVLICYWSRSQETWQCCAMYSLKADLRARKMFRTESFTNKNRIMIYYDELCKELYQVASSCFLVSQRVLCAYCARHRCHEALRFCMLFLGMLSGIYSAVRHLQRCFASGQWDGISGHCFQLKSE